jgi:hypothetical protein
MCHVYYSHHSGKGVPSPGDERCNVSDVEGLTSSVMAGLTTLDGLLCESSPIGRWIELMRDGKRSL